MTTETDTALEVAEQESGFAQGFTGETPKEPKAPESTPEPTPAPEVKEEPKETEAAPPAPSPALTADEIAAIKAAAQELPALKEKLREAHGRIGALNDLVKQTREQKKEEAKAPAQPTAVALKRMAEHYPELAGTLSEDMAEVLSTLKTEPTTSPEDIAKLVTERVAEARHEERKQTLAEEHPDWEDLKKGEELWKWVATLSKEDATNFTTSSNPKYVSKQLTAFKEWRDKASKAKETSQARLEANVTPQGANRPGKSTMSDDEALRKGFAEGFNS